MGTEQLPHLNLEDNPSQPSKKRVFLIAIFSFLILSLPVTVFLVQQQQQLSSQASVEETLNPENGIMLQSPAQTVGVNQQISVDVVIRADSSEVNLAQVKLQFNPSIIKVVELITNPAQTDSQVFFGKYWMSKGFDNTSGVVELTAGTPSPGIKTEPGGATYLLAQVHFITLAEGQTEISLTPDSSLLANSDSSPVQLNNQNLPLSISRDGSLTTSQTQTDLNSRILSRYSEMQPSSQVKNQVVITSPSSGEVFFYFRPLEITWNAVAESIKTVTLYLNGEQYGIIAENIPNNGRFTWTPSLSIPLPMLVPENTYALKITSLVNSVEESTSEISNPFGLIPDPAGKTVSSDSAKLKQPSNLTINDSSKMLSRWGEKLQQEDQLDLNGDWMINFLDWYLLRRELFVKDLVF
jgi:hypothetical protein